jgi:hypothetical protein
MFSQFVKFIYICISYFDTIIISIVRVPQFLIVFTSAKNYNWFWYCYLLSNNLSELIYFIQGFFRFQSILYRLSSQLWRANTLFYYNLYFIIFIFLALFHWLIPLYSIERSNENGHLWLVPSVWQKPVSFHHCVLCMMSAAGLL